MRLLKLVPDDTNIGFVRIRHWAFGLTALLTVAAVALVGIRGLNFGVDFVGGLMIEAKFASAPPLDQVREDVDRLGVGDGTLQQFDTVSGKVSGELIRNGVLAVLLAVIGIAVFSWLRYEWQFGVSTFVAIMHDVLMTLGFFALTRLEVDLNIVAAVLTIVGYSINDKMVIDDRIRENMRKFRQMDMRSLIDLSVNETLPRTVMTSLTIMIALASLLIFGGHVLRGFTAAMMLGIVVGTYSSIYVSSSLLISLGLQPQRFDGKPKTGRPDAERVGPKA